MKNYIKQKLDNIWNEMNELKKEHLYYHIKEDWKNLRIKEQILIELLDYEIKEISDDEIDKQAEPIEEGIYRMFFKTGAKWCKRQINKH
jgi:uncharacterized protein YaaW (UPF0174 family)